MHYDIIGGGAEYEPEEVSYFTIGDLIYEAEKYPSHKFYFLGTMFGVGDLRSWRGSYDLPCIVPSSPYEVKTGEEIAQLLKDGLNKSYCGWKGGEYRYKASDEFYVAECGTTWEYKVVKAQIEDRYDEEVVYLYTKLDPY